MSSFIFFEYNLGFFLMGCIKTDTVEMYTSICVDWYATNVFMNRSERVIRLLKMLTEVMLGYEW